MLPTKKAAAAVCRHCGAELVTQRAGARYCNDRCRLRAHRSGPGRVVRAELSVPGPVTRLETDKAPILRASKSPPRPLDPRIVPDPVWPGMYRIRKPDGTLTDMLNLTRAKDAIAYPTKR